MEKQEKTSDHVGDPENHLPSDVVEHASAEASPPPFKALSLLDRFLVLWIILAMAIGMLLGNFVPSTSTALQKGQFVGVSIPIAIGLLIMMYPILCKINYESLPLLLRSRQIWHHLLLSLLLNWLLAPLLMVSLAWAFLPDRPDLREGLIFVGIARCIAMVLIWNDLAGGDAEYCAILVAANSLLQIVLFAPLSVLYVRVLGRGGRVEVGYEKVATSVAVFLGIPLAAAIITRFTLRPLLGPPRYGIFTRYLSPLSLLGLLYTIIILFASQGAHVVRQITSVLRVAAPLIFYFVLIFTFTALVCKKLNFGYRVSCTQSFTAASNNFELAIAVVVAVYGADSQQAVASTVGPLVEVPVLVGLVYVMGWIKTRWNWTD